MTRINAGIPAKQLSNRHLLAEHREIKRLPNHLIKYGIACIKDAPTNFTLGKGHVKFFITKGYYTQKRYLEIYEECLARNFNVQNYSDNWKAYNYAIELFDDATFTEVEIDQIKQRLLNSDINHYSKIFKNEI